MKQKLKQSKGITLVSLVVTIIILIILSGVSINLVLGENGIVTIAKRAKENTEIAKVEEETRLNELAKQIEEGTSGGTTNPPETIKNIGTFTVDIKLYEGIIAQLKLNVVA